MLSVVIPTRNDERRLVPTLASLVAAAADGLVRDVLIADCGSADGTLEIVDLAGCVVCAGEGGRGEALAAAARRAKGPWLLTLEPGVALEEGWHREAASFIGALERAGEPDRSAAVFRYALDAYGERRRAAEWRAAASTFLTGLPLPEQGLLIHRSLYERAGGFRPLPVMAEADLIRRIGRSRIVRLRAAAVAPAARTEAGARGALGAGLLMLRVPPRVVARLYG